MTDTDRIIAAAKELLAAIDRRWEGESEKKRAAAISPRQEDAMEELRGCSSLLPHTIERAEDDGTMRSDRKPCRTRHRARGVRLRVPRLLCEPTKPEYDGISGESSEGDPDGERWGVH